MKLNLRRTLWALALAFAVSMFATPQLAAAYQPAQEPEHGRGHDKDKDDRDRDYANNPNYQQGLRHGQEDHEGKRALRYRLHPKNDADRRAYEYGYNQGYQGTYQGRPGEYGAYGNRPYGERGIQRVAYDNGFQKGLEYGQTDRTTGHSNRPTYSSTYKNGSTGYNSSMGDKYAYKTAFQQGFMAGYAQGYQGHRR